MLAGQGAHPAARAFEEAPHQQASWKEKGVPAHPSRSRGLVVGALTTPQPPLEGPGCAGADYACRERDQVSQHVRGHEVGLAC
jgi:hypothetical protein